MPSIYDELPNFQFKSMQIRKVGRNLYTIFFQGWGGGVGLSFAVQLTLGNFALGIPRRNQPCLLDFFSYHELSRMHDCFPFICCGSCLLFLFRFYWLWFNNQVAGGRNSSKRFLKANLCALDSRVLFRWTRWTRLILATYSSTLH